MAKNKILLISYITLLTFLYSLVLFQAGRYYGAAKYNQFNQATAVNHYVVKEYNNMIAVFEEGSDVPSKVLNIDVPSLRKQDRARFQEGIVVNSLDELTQLEEDFGS